MWLFVNNQHCSGYIQITTLNNKNTFGAPYHTYISEVLRVMEDSIVMAQERTGCARKGASIAYYFQGLCCNLLQKKMLFSSYHRRFLKDKSPLGSQTGNNSFHLEGLKTQQCS